MSFQHNVTVISCDEIHELPNGWSSEDFKEILELTDFDDSEGIDPSELKDYCVMVLQDLEPDEAAEIVLKQRFGERLKLGQIQNLAHEMIEDRIWEEYHDPNFHVDFYHCAVILRWAFPRNFPETNALKCTLSIANGARKMETEITKSFIARLLANGMDNHGLLNRLYANQISTSPFPEANGIIWDFKVLKQESETIIEIWSSEYWIHDMDDVSRFTSEAFSD